MIPLSLILRKANSSYFFKEKTKINHLLYLNDVKLFGKNKKEIECLRNTVRIFSEDICMEFGIDKCATVVLRRGKLDKENNDLVLSKDEIIKSLDENTSYKYLGMLETENIKNSELKEHATSEYKRRLKNIEIKIKRMKSYKSDKYMSGIHFQI